MPEAVVFPGSAAEVAAIVRLANEHRFPVVPRGAGTGRSGGSVPIEGGVVIVLTRLNRILEISRPDLVVVVEPGVILTRLKQAVELEGLYYPPDPASADFCTIGGNVAENAGGPRAFKYGVTREYVLGLDVALMGGAFGLMHLRPDLVEPGGALVPLVVQLDLPARPVEQLDPFRSGTLSGQQGDAPVVAGRSRHAHEARRHAAATLPEADIEVEGAAVVVRCRHVEEIVEDGFAVNVQRIATFVHRAEHPWLPALFQPDDQRAAVIARPVAATKGFDASA